MRKEDKGVIIEQLGEQLKAYPHFYLVDVTGMDAARTSSMRRTCFKNEIKMVVVKNTLLHKAFEASNIDFSPLYETLKGTTAVLFTQVANQPAKMLKDFVKGKETIPALKGAYAEEGFTPTTGDAGATLNTERVWYDKGAPQWGAGPNL